ncbi:MAG: hypothetical protein ABWZ82_05160, partial [Candidatus Limnocylindrales bacterium]
ATLVSALPVIAVDARTSIPEGMCSLWTTRQATNAMGEPMKVVREDPDYCVWYSRNDHSGNISTLSAGLWGGDPRSDVPLIDQARDQSWRGWTSEETVGGAPMLLTDVRRSRRNREITAAAFPGDDTWLDLNATSVIAKDVRRAVRRMVGIAAPKLAATSSASTAPVPNDSQTPPSGDACSLLTADEASEAIGETMTQADGTEDQCIWSGDQGSMLNLTILPAEAVDETGAMLDRRRELSPDAEDIEVAGFPALFEIGPLLGVPSVYVYPAPDIELELELLATREFDTRAALEGLAAVAVPRFVATAPATTPTPAASLTAAGGVCGLLSVDEVSNALGTALTPNDMGQACTYGGDVAAGDLTGMTIAVLLGEDQATAAEQMRSGGATELTVAGLPALQAPNQELPSGVRRSMVVVFPDADTSLIVSADAAPAIDIAAAVRALAELAVPRLGSLPGS